MKAIVAGSCARPNVYFQVDPASYLETTFEMEVIAALQCLYSGYWCGVFAGSFVLEGERRRGDLALVHRSFSHWFVIEVELVSHSLDGHVLPQIRCLRYGEPDDTCVASLERAFPRFGTSQVAALLREIPRFVGVVGNLYSDKWNDALRGLDAQYLALTVYENRDGAKAHELTGALFARMESLGFARYSATTNTLRIKDSGRIATGKTQMVDQFGVLGDWTVREADGVLWFSKDRGIAFLQHDEYVQLIRGIDGKLMLRPSITYTNRREW